MRADLRSAILLLVLLGGFAARVYRLGTASLWYDETVSMYLAQLDLGALTRHTAGDIHPPLYYYLLHFWTRLAGTSEFSAAFLSLFFGVLLIALVHRATRAWFDERVARWAAFLVAISPFNLWYSQEVRMYTFGAFLGLASVYLFVRLLASSKGYRFRASRGLIAYAFVSVCGLYTLYYFAFLLAFQNLAAVFWRVRDSQFSLRTWISSQFAILLLYLPWAPIAYRQATDPPVPPWREFTPAGNVMLESLAALTLGQSVEWQSPSWAWGVVFFALIALGAGISSMSRSQSPVCTVALDVRGVGLAAYTFVPLLLIQFLSLWKPLYHVRYIFTYSPAFYMLLAMGLVKLARIRSITPKYLSRVAAYAFLLLFSIGSIYSAYNFWFDPQFADDDLGGAVKRIAELWRPGDAVLINAGYTYTVLLYYFDQPIVWRGRVTNYPPLNVSIGTIQRLADQRAGAIVLQTGSMGADRHLGWNSPESDFYATTAEETRAALDRVLAAHQRLWMLRLYDTVVDPQGIARDHLADRARLIHDEVFSGQSNARVQGYLTSKTRLTQLPSSATRREVLLGNRIAFLGFEPQGISVRAGEPIDVILYWRAQEPTNADLRVYIGLFGEDGTVVAAADELPLGNALGSSRWDSEEVIRQPARLVSPKHLSGGNYLLRIALYNPFTNEPLSAEKSGWVIEASQIQIARVRID